MARKTYVATKTVEVVFTADVEAGDKLDDVARHAFREDDGEGDIETEEIRHVPCDWDEDCLVYGTHKGYLSLKEALSPEMAPKFHEQKSRNAKALMAAEGIKETP